MQLAAERLEVQARLLNHRAGRTTAELSNVVIVNAKPMSQFSELSEALELEAGSGDLLSLDLRIIYVNDGWRRSRERTAHQSLPRTSTRAHPSPTFATGLPAALQNDGGYPP